MQKNLRRHLSAHPYFQFLNDAQIVRLLSEARMQIYTAEDIIFLDGEPATHLWWLESGRVKIYKINAGGNEQILHLANAGESFNDIAVFDGGTNPANTAALTTAKIWQMPAATVRDLIYENQAVCRAVVQMLAARVRMFTLQIADLTLYSVNARLARFLLDQSEGAASFAQSGITRKAIAGRLATTPETISRTLRTMQKVGAIQFDRHHIVILDRELLNDIALL
jgi:CRP/FNR family transcriptional regulator